MSELLNRARQWIAQDPDPNTQAELQALIDNGEHSELAERFAGPLSFGTAGLRAPVRAGENGMNIATITRTTAGLAAWLKTQVERPEVVVGCDARHGSHAFHQATAETLSAAGCIVHLLPAQLPTPITAFACRHLNADAAVMITASHNPAPDNGYKVYLGGRICQHDYQRGVQLISPADKEISKEIAAQPAANQILRNRELIYELGDEITECYLQRTCSLVEGNSDYPMVITAMHGVGGSLLLKALQRAGFTKVYPVAQQQEPDPDFPTVAFPNPEEAGALDLAYQEGSTRGAGIVLALDPDADRCSVAVRIADSWQQLSGDNVGALLGEDLAAQAFGTMACSIVSSRLLSHIAHAHGLKSEPTLTGFKWIGRVPQLSFGYEEALGYCTDPQFVRDKDGISACLRMADLAARLAATAKTLLDQLEEIYRTYGYFRTTPLTLRFEDSSQIVPLLQRIQADPPRTLAGSPVVETTNLAEGFHGLPGTPGLMLRTEKDDRVIIRPSGTEPKLKCYLETIDTDPTRADQRIEGLLDDLRTALS